MLTYEFQCLSDAAFTRWDVARFKVAKLRILNYRSVFREVPWCCSHLQMEQNQITTVLNRLESEKTNNLMTIPTVYIILQARESDIKKQVVSNKKIGRLKDSFD